jgi:small-conductance mechanosensitive channel
MSIQQINEFLQAVLENNITQLVIGGIFIFIITVFLQRLVRSVLSRTKIMDGKESDTLISLLQSIIKYIAVLGFLFFALSVFGLDVGGMLAGAGVLGIIIGFGAQSLVQDLLAGFFIVYEKQLQKGDWVIVNEAYEGVVEEVGFRVLKIRDWSATVISINNGQVRSVENFNKNKMRVLERVTVSYYEDPSRILRILEEICDELNHELKDYLKQNVSGQPIEPFTVLGVDSINDQHQGYRYIISGLVGDLNYFSNARSVRTTIAKHMYKNNVKMPQQAIHITESSNHNEHQ